MSGTLRLVFEGYAEPAFALKRRLPGDHFVEDRSQSIDIRPLIDAFAGRLLRRHVMRRSDHHPGFGQVGAGDLAGNAEIHDPDAALGVDPDIVRFKIPVDNAQPVSLSQARRDLRSERTCYFGREPAFAAEQRSQILARHILHGDEECSGFFMEVVQPADILVTDAAGQLELVFEALDGRCVGNDFGPEDLEGHFLVDLQVQDLIDGAHSARPQLVDDLVAAGKR